MRLDKSNYYSLEADREYMSVSQYKSFAGSYGMLGCEFAAMERLAGRWREKPSPAMMVGSYVDAHFEGTLDEFKAENPSIFKRDGGLKSEYSKAEEVIARAERDPYFMKYMSGEKQAIFTGELFGARWKAKLDSYIPGVAIVDLKVMSSITELKWVRDVGYLDFVRYYGYDLQGAVYQELVRQETGRRLPFYIAAATKQDEPDIRIIHVTDDYLREAMETARYNMPRVLAVKRGEAEPERCELCACCRRARVLSAPISISDLTHGV